MFPDSPVAARDDIVYAKTDKGRAEVARRAIGLSGRERSVLIMVDGRKPCAVLAATMAPGVVAAIVDGLLARHLIAPLGVHAAACADGSGPAAPRDPARLAQVKARMTRTAETYLGVLAADVVRRIERAADEAALLGVIGHWHMALQDSKHGRAVALAHVEEVRASLAGMHQAGVERLAG